MSNDWQNALQSLLDGGSLPEGDDTAPHEEQAEPRQTGKLSINMEKKGRAGKTATIVSGFTLPDEAVCEIAATLKSRLGTGGSARGGEILIQGDRRDDVKSLLQQMGYKI